MKRNIAKVVVAGILVIFFLLVQLTHTHEIKKLEARADGAETRLDAQDALLEELSFKNTILGEENGDLREYAAELEIQSADLATDTCYFESLGNFEISYYTQGEAGVNDTTATGTKVYAGRTVAVDPAVIPYGSEIYVKGIGFLVAEDCGGAIDGKELDVYVDAIADIPSVGRHSAEVWIKRYGGFE